MRQSLNLVKHRWTFILVSLLIIVPGVIFIAIGGLRPGIDFTGGSSWDIYFDAKKVPDGALIEQTIKDADAKYINDLTNKANKNQAEINLLNLRKNQTFEAISQESTDGL